MNCDLIVVGAGLAGMTAGLRAVSHGLKTIVAGNSASLAFAGGLMDYLGSLPAGDYLSEPGRGLGLLEEELPAHPYSLAGHDSVMDSFSFIRDALDSAGLAYHLSSGTNLPVITSMGTVKPSFMVPETMKKGSLAFGKDYRRLLVVGIKGFQEFSPAQVAAGLKRYFDTIPLTISLPGVDTSIFPRALAARFETREVQEAFSRKILPYSDRADLVGIPAVCGQYNSYTLLKQLEDMVGMDLFEIPGMPPSMPGFRLKQAYEKALADKGGIFLNQARVTDPVFDGKSFILTGKTDSRQLKISAKGVILATGRFFGNGLHARRERIVETLFRLNVLQPLKRRSWHQPEFLDPRGHAINRAGVEIDHRFRPMDERQRPVYKNLYAAGSILAHNDWTRLKSGAGTALVSACRAVDNFVQDMVKGCPGC